MKTQIFYFSFGKANITVEDTTLIIDLPIGEKVIVANSNIDILFMFKGVQILIRIELIDKLIQ